MGLEEAPGIEVGVVCEPRAGVDSEVDVDEPGLELDATSELDASLDPDKVDSVTGSVKVVGSEVASPDEVDLDRLGTEDVGSFESDGGDVKPAFGTEMSRVNDATPSDVMPDDGLPDDVERPEVVKSNVVELKEAVSDDAKLEPVMADVTPDSRPVVLEVGDFSPDVLEAVLALTSVELTINRELSESEETLGDVVPEDVSLAETKSEDALVGTVADEPSEVRSDEPRRTLVMKPEDVKDGHEGLKEDREEEAGPETAEETGFVADCGSEDVAEIDNPIAFEEVSTIKVFDEVGVDVSGSELGETDEARPEDCECTSEEVGGVAKTGRDDAEIEEAELGDPRAEGVEKIVRLELLG
ncbi:hypothetical protein E4U59_005275 [Claviceps monticola]|nr:hypothetical protein E4U59_005275 [Claviceps monticola]